MISMGSAPQPEICSCDTGQRTYSFLTRHWPEARRKNTSCKNVMLSTYVNKLPFDNDNFSASDTGILGKKSEFSQQESNL